MATSQRHRPLSEEDILRNLDNSDIKIESDSDDENVDANYVILPESDSNSDESEVDEGPVSTNFFNLFTFLSVTMRKFEYFLLLRRKIIHRPGPSSGRRGRARVRGGGTGGQPVQRSQAWKHKTFQTIRPDMQVPEHEPDQERAHWTPSDYLNKYYQGGRV